MMTHKRFENTNSLLWLQSYPTNHLYVLVLSKIFEVLYLFILYQDVSDRPSRSGVKVLSLNIQQSYVDLKTRY